MSDAALLGKLRRLAVRLRKEEELVDRLRARRDEAIFAARDSGCTLAQVAAAAGISGPAVSKLERRRREREADDSG